MNRRRLFESLSDPVKDLLTLLYGSEKDFIREEDPVQLEDLLVSYDKVMGNDIYVKKLASSIFLIIPSRIDPDMYFLTTIETFLLSKVPKEESFDKLGKGREGVENLNPKTRKELERLLLTKSFNSKLPYESKDS